MKKHILITTTITFVFGSTDAERRDQLFESAYFTFSARSTVSKLVIYEDIDISTSLGTKCMLKQKEDRVSYIPSPADRFKNAIKNIEEYRTQLKDRGANKLDNLIKQTFDQAKELKACGRDKVISKYGDLSSSQSKILEEKMEALEKIISMHHSMEAMHGNKLSFLKDFLHHLIVWEGELRLILY